MGNETYARSFRTLAFPAVLLAMSVSSAHAADPGKMTISVDKPGAKMPPTFHGLMTEEINHAYDGGLFGELIQNRIFKDPPAAGGRRNGGGAPQPATPAVAPHWAPVTTGDAKAVIALDTADPVNTTALTTSLRLDITAADKNSRAGVANDGFWGIPALANAEYKVSFYAKAKAGFTGPLTVDIETNDGQTIHATAAIPAITTQWKKYEATLKTGALTPSATNRFVISATAPGTVWINLVSVFPPTYKDRPDGFRIDLMDKLAGMDPKFLRFPGGNYLEGNNLAGHFDWKKTIGPVEDRPGHQGPWGYRSADGLGLLEFLEWCEDLKMEPVLAVYAGLHLDGGNTVITGDALKPYVEESLEEIEYVTGDAKTKWGAQRIKDGHPGAFKLNYVEIGNEDNLNNGGRTYDGRFTLFYDAIKAKYPKLQIIATTNVRTRRADVIDDHFYNPAANLERQATRFDNYNRNGPKVFFGEWASQEGNPTPNMLSALGDAAFLSGLERNCDVVVMECYAPLLVNVNRGAAQWGTNLIGYDALNSFSSPSYYAQKMFSTNQGDTNLPLAIAPQTIPPAPPPPANQPAGQRPPGPVPPLIGNAFKVDATGEVIIKMVNTANIPQQMEITLNGVKEVDKNATLILLTGQLNDVNSLREPTKIVPKESAITDAGVKFVHEFPGYSVSVIRLKTK